MTIRVRFEYHTGLSQAPFDVAHLTGSWDGDGRRSDQWSTVPMDLFRDESDAVAFRATVSFADDQKGKQVCWGVKVDGASGNDVWAIPQEREENSRERHLSFCLSAETRLQRFDLTHLRELGANRLVAGGKKDAGARFAVWAPNAKAVELVFGDRAHGYIDDLAKTAESKPGQFPMTLDEDTGVWSIDSARHPDLGTFSDCVGRAYMFRITRDDGSVAMRTDLYSRCQAGEGSVDPGGRPFTGSRKSLDGTKSCSLVIDPDRVAARFEHECPAPDSVEAAQFWKDEHNPKRPVPKELRDLVIYELHVNGLGFGRKGPGTLTDAMKFIDHLDMLGVNAVELLPLAEYQGASGWGYGTSHFCAIERAAGGPDQFKHFVRECHRRGIAVLLDVVYNHYSGDAERAEWRYDSNEPVNNIYYWYEGSPDDYPDFQHAVPDAQRNDGGYVDNYSSGWAPRFCEEKVRHLFIDSAVSFMQEFHVDGFRVDQVTSIHREPALHANGKSADRAKAAGVRFLRDWTRTLKLLKPEVMLVAEDHSDWDKVTASPDEGGLGFDAIWYPEYYHTLCGDTGRIENLLRAASFGTSDPIAMRHFGEVADRTSEKTVIYQESHDEAGNSKGGEWTSGRTLSVAVNGAPLIGETRRFAEARCRFVAGMTLLAGGVPMFFMGEEVGCINPYRFDDFLKNREDFNGLRQGEGAKLFSCFSALLRLRRTEHALRAGASRMLFADDASRVLAFQRRNDEDEFVVVGTLSNSAFPEYVVSHPGFGDARWREVFNSDDERFGGSGLNNGAGVGSQGGALRFTLPANSVVVFQRVR